MRRYLEGFESAATLGAIIKIMASSIELQRTDEKKQKEAKTKQKLERDIASDVWGLRDIIQL